jgi:phage repressor protein C with HTH and peptisase S24 domain
MVAAAAPAPSLRFELAAAMLREGRTVELPATGTSMRPLIAPGGVVRVEPARAADVRPGDVVLVETGGRLVCHRLVYVAAGRAVTRGDNVVDCDAPLPADAIIGRVAISPSPHALYCAVRALLR